MDTAVLDKSFPCKVTLDKLQYGNKKFPNGNKLGVSSLKKRVIGIVLSLALMLGTAAQAAESNPVPVAVVINGVTMEHFSAHADQGHLLDPPGQDRLGLVVRWPGRGRARSSERTAGRAVGRET